MKKQKQSLATRQAHWRALAKLPVTPEEKTRWKPILQRVWNSLAYDVIQACGGEASRDDVIEFVCDAGRPCEVDGYGEVMTREEYDMLCHWSHTPAFKQWMKEVFPCNYYVI